MSFASSWFPRRLHSRSTGVFANILFLRQQKNSPFRAERVDGSLNAELFRLRRRHYGRCACGFAEVGIALDVRAHHLVSGMISYQIDSQVSLREYLCTGLRARSLEYIAHL